MFVMEPADKENKDNSHVAHKMKRIFMKFEDGNGKYCVKTTHRSL